MSRFHRHSYVDRWKGTVPWRLVMGALALVMTLSTFLVAPFIPGGSSPAPSAKSAQNLGAGTAAAADTVGGRQRDRRRQLVAAAGDVRHGVVARPAGHDVGRHRPAGRRVLPDDFGHDHGGHRAVPRAAAADAVRQGVHRRRLGHRQHERRLPRRPRLHRRHRRRARDGRLGRHLRPLRPRAVDRRRDVGPVGGASAAVERRGRPLRRVLHGHQPVPDGAGGRQRARRSRRCSRSSRATTCTPTP